MRILMPHFLINDYGGITNSTEGLIRGFHDLGHEVFPVLLEWKPFGTYRTEVKPGYGDSESATGLSMEQRGGYFFGARNRFGYKGATKKWKQFVKNFDLILWQVPVPTQTAANRGNHEWLELYDTDVPQIAHNHDGNIGDIPWISAVAGQWRGLGCVHSCALKSAKKFLPLPMSMVPSPQWDIEQRMAGGKDSRQRSGWLSVQTFKAWKRVGDIVRAIPFMEHGPKQIAGGGIERYYMTSPDKVKPIYTWRENDIDFRPEFRNKTIWQVALDHKMKYLDFIGNEQRDSLLQKRVALIDASWSHKYAQYGAHVNRVVIDALICGAVPIMRDWKDPDSPLQPHVHFQVLPPTEDGPEAIAKAIDKVCYPLWSSWMVKAREVLPLFEAKRAASIFLELAEGRGTHRGRNNKVYHARGQEALRGYFGMV
jgi:hypothetical protein